jgi:cell division septation protein DedD
MNNQRGGIISKVILVPIGFAFAVGFFVLGYYVGRYQVKETSQAEKLPALPEVVSEYLPKKEELTFFKTLMEKGARNVSVDLKPKSKIEEESPPARKAASETEPPKSADTSHPERTVEIRLEKAPATELSRKETASAKPAGAKLRYTIQVASYPEKELAEDEVRNMKRKGYAAVLVASQLSDKGTWYRVRIGSFTNKAAAERLANELRAKEGLNPFVTVE